MVTAATALMDTTRVLYLTTLRLDLSDCSTQLHVQVVLDVHFLVLIFVSLYFTFVCLHDE